jgi:hypothetical protein
MGCTLELSVTCHHISNLITLFNLSLINSNYSVQKLNLFLFYCQFKKEQINIYQGCLYTHTKKKKILKEQSFVVRRSYLSTRSSRVVHEIVHVSRLDETLNLYVYTYMYVCICMY